MIHPGPNYAGLDESFDEPFDKVYKLVTAEITTHPVHTSHKQASVWLNKLTTEFEAEYQKWPHDREYRKYFEACRDQKLWFKFLYLTLGAYLHISYDLPRVISRNWPTGGYPTEELAEEVFFKLSPMFPEIFGRAVRDKDVMGWFRARFEVPESARIAASHWMMHLRTAAWVHARRLHLSPTDRVQREKNMMKALIAAVEHVCNSDLLSAARLIPPHAMLVPMAQITPTASSTESGMSIGSKALMGLVCAAIGVAIWKRRRDRQVVNLIEALGWRILLYTNRAVHCANPEEFDKYLVKQEMALKAT